MDLPSYTVEQERVNWKQEQCQSNKKPFEEPIRMQTTKKVFVGAQSPIVISFAHIL